MAKDILVSVMCDDVFARNWLTLLLVRDWRTRVVSEIRSGEDYMDHHENDFQAADFIVVDMDSYDENPGLIAALNEDIAAGHPVKVIAVGTEVEPRLFTRLKKEYLAGYLLKSELSFSIGWAVTFASEGQMVFTPTTYQAAWSANYEIPKEHIVLRSRRFPGITERQSEIARLAIIFSIGRRDLADELKISDQWSYGVVSELYEKLGLDRLAENEDGLHPYLEEDPVIKSHIDDILEELGDGKKARDIETLAFHLLTMPTIE